MDIGTFAGMDVVEDPGMIRGSWMIKDMEGRIMIAGVIGEGTIVTPGYEGKAVSEAWVAPDVYSMIRAARLVPEESRGKENGRSGVDSA